MFSRLFCSCVQLSTIALASLIFVSISSISYGQGPTEVTSLHLTGDGVGGATPDWLILPQSPFSTFAGNLAFFGPTGLSKFNIFEDVPGGASSLGPNGLGIGFGALSGSGNRIAQVPLHVVGGDPDDAFPLARAIVNDRNPNPGFRELLTLQNDSGGGVRLTMNDGEAGNAIYTLDNFNGRFNIFNSTRSRVNLGISNDAQNNLEIGAGGVGVGTFLPTSKIHSFSGDPNLDSSTIASEVAPSAGTRSRTMLLMKNSGGAFMTFTDTSTNSTWFFSNANGELNLRRAGGGVSPAMRIKASGEVAFVANQANRFQIFPNGDVRPGFGGTYLTPSDRNLKENFVTLDTSVILNKVAELPITSWNYKDDEAKRRHIGPMAQDFFVSFGLGGDDKTICEMDKDGIALAAIQGLNAKVESKDQKIEDLSKIVKQQTELIAELTARMEQLESTVAPAQK